MGHGKIAFVFARNRWRGLTSTKTSVLTGLLDLHQRQFSGFLLGNFFALALTAAQHLTADGNLGDKDLLMIGPRLIDDPIAGRRVEQHLTDLLQLRLVV